MDLDGAVQLHETFTERSNISQTPTPTLLSILEKLEKIINHELDEVLAEKGIK